MKEFNVITEPWIPVIMKDNTRKTYGVRDVLRKAKDIKCIVSPGNLPSEEYAIYRFLFALTTDAYKIRSDADIERIYHHGEFDLKVFDEYVAACGNVFDAFDVVHPFMQCGVNEAISYGAKPKSAASFSWGKLSGKTETFFGTRDLPPARTYEAAQSLSIPEYIALCINITFMQSAVTSGFPAAVCGNQPPLWFRLNGCTLFDTICLNMYPTTDDDTPLWRRGKFLWQPETEQTGWLALAFMPTRIIAPNEDGIRDDQIYEVLLNSCFYRGNAVLETYKPASFYDWWLMQEPYVVICHNDSPKRPSGVPAVTAWRGPAGIEWMHMAEFYGVQYETRRMERPRIMMAYGEKTEKQLIKVLPYKPTQVFYRAELPTQNTKASQSIFDGFPETDDWMYEDSVLSTIQCYTNFTQYALKCFGDALCTMLYPHSEKRATAVDDYINGLADGLSGYMYNTLIPALKDVSEIDVNSYLKKAYDDVISYTDHALRTIHTRDAFTKFSESNKLNGRLRKYVSTELLESKKKEEGN